MKIYTNKNVYEAVRERLAYLFNEFEQLVVAFSGGKDSGVMLNLAYDYAKEHQQLHKLTIYHLDYEAQYQATTDYVTEVFNSYEGIQKYWLCLPIRAQCAINSTNIGWIPWEKAKEDIWVRPLPQHKAVIHEDNVPFTFKEGEWDYDIQNRFCEWVSRDKKTAILVGIRTSESLNRFRAIKGNHKVNVYDDKQWIVDDGHIKAYPIYDWTTEDVWIANAKFEYSYNKLYDLFFQVGLNIDQMRVASPFNDAAVSSLKLYKVIDPLNWGKMIGRVKGVNFAGIYGGTTAMGWKSIKLPEGHTWKTYLEFLLSTLTDEMRENYLSKFETSIKFWREKGGVLSDETIQELRKIGMNFKISDEKSNYKTEKKIVKFEEYPDDADVKDFKSVPSYKRMCICIMKNDHLCKYMGFSQTKAENQRRKEALKKYEDIL